MVRVAGTADGEGVGAAGQGGSHQCPEIAGVVDTHRRQHTCLPARGKRRFQRLRAGKFQQRRHRAGLTAVDDVGQPDVGRFDDLDAGPLHFVQQALDARIGSRNRGLRDQHGFDLDAGRESAFDEAQAFDRETARRRPPARGRRSLDLGRDGLPAHHGSDAKPAGTARAMVGAPPPQAGLRPPSPLAVWNGPTCPPIVLKVRQPGMLERCDANFCVSACRSLSCFRPARPKRATTRSRRWPQSSEKRGSRCATAFDCRRTSTAPRKPKVRCRRSSGARRTTTMNYAGPVRGWPSKPSRTVTRS